jgi:hypothetical protein
MLKFILLELNCSIYPFIKFIILPNDAIISGILENKLELNFGRLLIEIGCVEETVGEVVVGVVVVVGAGVVGAAATGVDCANIFNLLILARICILGIN